MFLGVPRQARSAVSIGSRNPCVLVGIGQLLLVKTVDQVRIKAKPLGQVSLHLLPSAGFQV